MADARRILYLQFTNPAGYPPLAHSSQILAERGWCVLFLGVRLPSGATLVFDPVDNVRTRIFPFLINGRWLPLKYVAFTMWALWKTLCFRPQWIYASDDLILPIALFFQKILRCRLLYHEHDFHSRSFSRRYRAKIAKVAEVCVLPQPERAKLFESEVSPPRKPIVVLNCPSLREIHKHREPRPALPLRLLFQGSVHPRHVPLAVLRAIKGLPIELQIIGYFPDVKANYRETIEREVERLDIAAQVKIFGVVSPRTRMFEFTAAADVGLALLPLVSDCVNENFMVGASNKVFENLACGSPILVPDRADWRTGFVEPGYALACDPESEESIAKALRWFVDHPDERAEMGRRGRERCEKDWNYEFQFAPVVQILESPPAR